MITQKEIENSLKTISEYDENEFLDNFNKTLQKQNYISQFLTESVNINKLDKQTESSFAELIFYILKIYEDKYQEKYKIADIQDIVDTMKNRNDRLNNIANKFGLSPDDKDFDKKFAEHFYRFNMVVSGNKNKLENLSNKEYNLFMEISNENKKHILEPKVSEYANIFFTTDKDMNEDKKQIINSLTETVIETLNNIHKW